MKKKKRKTFLDYCESFLIVRPSDEPNIHQAIFTPIDKIVHQKPADTPRFILEGISTGLATNFENVEDLTANLLMTLEEQNNSQRIVEKLRDDSFISIEEDSGILEATQLGKATMASALPPEAALAIFEDLSVAKRAIVLDTELHMLYLVTPVNVTVWQEADWHHLFEIFTRLPEEHRRVAKIIGINERFLVDRMRGAGIGGAENERKFKMHIRFFSTLALFDLINEVDIHQVSEKYRIPRGSLQTLQSQSATYAGHMADWLSLFDVYTFLDS
ncbi:unnamed protein product [Caenorhabditis angaria]|uniref:POLQ-like helical domain-containing protein n=1 Tax=Caenorhabditis angaria TaxID=860376 RepID=A0A9P1IHK0_9PELO|nr:unnamed protein product [Caenorhabditis angaria]